MGGVGCLIEGCRIFSVVLGVGCGFGFGIWFGFVMFLVLALLS